MINKSGSGGRSFQIYKLTNGDLLAVGLQGGGPVFRLKASPDRSGQFRLGRLGSLTVVGGKLAAVSTPAESKSYRLSRVGAGVEIATRSGSERVSQALLELADGRLLHVQTRRTGVEARPFSVEAVKFGVFPLLGLGQAIKVDNGTAGTPNAASGNPDFEQFDDFAP